MTVFRRSRHTGIFRNETTMNTLLSILTYLTALNSALPFLKPKYRLAAFLLWPFKLVADALSPLLAVLSILAAVRGLLLRDGKLVAAGIIGALFAGRYGRSVTTEHNAFAGAFGPDWPYRIPANIKPLILPRRWTPLMPVPDDYAWQPNIVYGKNPETGESLVADIWQPRPGVHRSGLAVIYVHGGAWRLGKKDQGTRPFFKRLASQGHVIMDIEYTITPTTPLDVMVRDVKRAILWMKQYSGHYGVNPDRIVLIGGSAGGHLALLAAYTPNLSELQPEGRDEDTAVHGVVALYPPTDLRRLYEITRETYGDLAGQGPISFLDRGNVLGFQIIGIAPRDDEGHFVEFLVHIMGGTPAECPDTYRLLSPTTYVGPDCPPTLLLQDSDDIFQLEGSVKQMHQDLVKAGATSILIEYPHTEHAFDIILPRVSPVAQSAIYEVERFLALMV